MRLPRRQFLRLAAAATAVPALPRAVFAQSAASTWPNRVVRLIVGFPPGGGADSAARIAADRLSKIWGQQVVVENKGGAGGNIAHDTAAHAPPDGYTMLFSPSSLPIMPMLYTSLGYNPMTDFAMVSTLGRYPNPITVSKESPFASLQQLIDHAKANPGKVTFATPGIGSTPHLTAELFKKMAGVDMTHVPYRGVAAGAMSDLLSNRIDSMFNTTGSLLQAVRSGQVRGLAQSTPKRSPLAPELPTFAEAGVPGFDVSSWYGLFAPAKTLPEIVKKMHDDTAKLLGEPETRKKYENLGIEAASATADEMTAMMTHEVALWGPVIKAANIRGE
jgi:tripartite-type tricarboxylate transporter receptor subunit TctC